MVESLQMDWQLSDPKEVMLLLVRQARDRERQEAPLLTLLEELECSGAVDPVAYFHQLVRQDRLQQGMSEALVSYERLPYSHLVGIQTPAARRERWRRAVWTIMMHNRACVRSEDRWFIHYWAVLALAGGDPLGVGRYLEERSEGLRRHHDLVDILRSDLKGYDAIMISMRFTLL
ncbi:hypothetical protein KSC_023040 [Ktedonobacter sp. SOSP1-52]|uniref:hypothetical protein n=1 Tax=Ktedonobacter sp. SOSP1-52 TaxID=2778366 RepID=UPI0019167198|nr:hypothetical protein [Ktedonobacter sp. SOSP1-52]GHO63412.1 hypothetical protein KSC_023040 [Ktedonobacter sp. SOSP1-52]